MTAGTRDAADRSSDRAADGSSDGSYVTSADGAVLRVRSAGDPRRPVVLIASACGMPAELCEPWLRFLQRDHHVLTWETRGLFGGGADGPPGGTADAFDRLGHGVVDQVGDMIAILDRHGVGRAHVMGLCGGAALALRAADRHPDRVSSLSLWHGDYQLGPGCPKTSHQRTLQALMAIAAESRDSAAVIRGNLLQAVTAGLPPDIADLVLYPYGSDELLYRYCRLNGALMAHDVQDTLPRLAVPVLVVTSEDDATAHPQGSRAVAEAVSGAQLHVEPHGDHISLFAAQDALTAAAARFLAGTGRPGRTGRGGCS